MVDLLDYPIDLSFGWHTGHDFRTYFGAAGAQVVHSHYIVRFHLFLGWHPIAAFFAHMGQQTSFLHLAVQSLFAEADPMFVFAASEPLEEAQELEHQTKCKKVEDP